ncbi:hypothetical protein CAPTEDRAFT_212970 [Capitella teleta]|uniref:G-protein coupled receptors family 2 profile 2 domain-containing protein n=1 Tax=Capitella teleta TaxID=283909 RepID=R7UG94_CAPTE|nr:hypothetical protein CAPTEDRAFT_212970 [Capitella teleta]|eukprot:ELU02823.1 hypothetical protein CAPTEDRAFT_212970 [Capitella teleta]
MIFKWIGVSMCVLVAAQRLNTKQKDILPSLSSEQREAIENYRDPRKPATCIDVCRQEMTENDFGRYLWENTSVGYRRFVDCNQPAWDEYAFAYRDCLLDSYGNVYWSSYVNFTNCELMKIPAIRLLYEKPQIKGSYTYRRWLVDSFTALLDVFGGYYPYEQSFYGEDALFIYSVAYYVINDYEILQDTISFERLIRYLAFALREEFVPFIQNDTNVLFYGSRIFNALPHIADKYGPDAGWIDSRDNTLQYIAETITNDAVGFYLYFGRTWFASVLPCGRECNYTIRSFLIDSPVFVEIELLLRNRTRFHQDDITAKYRKEYLHEKMVFISARNVKGNVTSGYPILEITYSAEFPFMVKKISIINTACNMIVSENSYSPFHAYVCLGSLFSCKPQLENQRCALNFEYQGFYDMGLWNAPEGASHEECEMRLNRSYETIIVTNGTGYFGLISKNRNRIIHDPIKPTNPPSLEEFLVFDKGVTSFVSKAAFVSWGTPVALVGLVVIADGDAFLGSYADCVFRCTLNENVLFYAFLLPMSLIMLHNFAVFGFVMRILCLPRKFETSSDGDKLPTMRQVTGGIALLALLGLPWIFSVFGAIDGTKDNKHLKNTEVVFQVIFSIGVNLQGVFIFAFHCLRNPEVRGQWRKTLFKKTPPLVSQKTTTSITSVPPMHYTEGGYQQDFM